jgi:hypothetical protein
MISAFKQVISDLHSKDREALKVELNNLVNLNAQLDKKLEVSLNNRTRLIERMARSGVSDAINAHLSAAGGKIDKILESKASRMEQSFDKKTQNIFATNLAKYREDVNNEKHDLRAVSTDAMRKEFERVFNDDAHLAKIVARYQKMFAEGAEHAAKIHKETEDKFNDELMMLRDRIALESQNILNKQLSETIKKQRELLDTELAKALSSNKYFVSRFEKEVINREKTLLESADRKLKENYNRHDNMLGAEFNKYYHELNDIKVQFDKELKARETQFNESISSRILRH